MTSGWRRDVDQLPVFRFNGDNRLEFLSRWPDVCAHFGFRALPLDDPPLAGPVLDEDGGNLEQLHEWDILNGLAKSKLNFYIMKDIYAIVWGGDDLSALQFYQRQNEMFL